MERRGGGMGIGPKRKLSLKTSRTVQGGSPLITVMWWDTAAQVAKIP